MEPPHDDLSGCTWASTSGAATTVGGAGARTRGTFSSVRGRCCDRNCQMICQMIWLPHNSMPKGTSMDTDCPRLSGGCRGQSATRRDSHRQSADRQQDPHRGETGRDVRRQPPFGAGGRAVTGPTRAAGNPTGGRHLRRRPGRDGGRAPGRHRRRRREGSADGPSRPRCGRRPRGRPAPRAEDSIALREALDGRQRRGRRLRRRRRSSTTMSHSTRGRPRPGNSLLFGLYQSFEASLRDSVRAGTAWPSPTIRRVSSTANCSCHRGGDHQAATRAALSVLDDHAGQVSGSSD